MKNRTPFVGAFLFAGALSIVLLFVLILPQVRQSFAQQSAEGTVIIRQMDGSPAGGARLRLLDESGEEIHAFEADDSGQVDLADHQDGWSRMLITHGMGPLETGASLEGPVEVWPVEVTLTN